MRTAKRTGYQRPAKHKQGEKQDDRFLAMVCFQMALCILAAAVFFAACRGEQGERDFAVYKTAQLLCGQQSERFLWSGQFCMKHFLRQETRRKNDKSRIIGIIYIS